jgi:hypothetical protein
MDKLSVDSEKYKIESTTRSTRRTTLYAFLANYKTQPRIQARAQYTRFISRFDHTTKVSYSPFMSPQRAGSFSTPIRHNQPQRSKEIFSQIGSQERVIQTSWGRPQLWRLPSNLNPSRNSKVSRTTSSHKRCLQQDQLMRNGG